MRTIWKYELSPGWNSVLQIPKCGQFRHGQAMTDGGRIRFFIWVEVDPTAEKLDTHIKCIGTGQDIPTDSHYYLCSLIEHGFVWHYYLDPQEGDQ